MIRNLLFVPLLLTTSVVLADEVPTGERVALSKTVSLQQQTTRTHHPGNHRVDVVVNGTVHAAGSFLLG